VSGVLVIGYGNTLRGDDAAGVLAARAVARRHPEVRVVEAHALLPELAEEIATAVTVIFLDADVHAGEVTMTELGAPDLPFREGAHAFTPLALLQLARQLYGAAPEQALLVGIPASSFELGESLSPRTRDAIEAAAASAGDLIRTARLRHGSAEPSHS
jgi:hydrogenase maturation protease